MAIEMPEMNGIEAIAIAKTLYPQIHFIIVTVFDDDDDNDQSRRLRLFNEA